MGRSITFRSLLGMAVLLFLCAAGYVIFVLTEPGQRFDNAAYFGRGASGAEVIQWDRNLLGAVTKGYLAGVLVLLAVLALARRRWMSGTAAAFAVLLSVGGAEALKSNLPHPELAMPQGAEPGYFREDTYPSGHTASGCSLALGLILVSSARWRAAMSGVCALVCAAYATGVVFLGWHRPSDALGGILWTGACFALAVGVLVFLRGSPRAFVFRGPAALVMLVFTGILALVCAWVGAGITGGGGGVAFHLMLILIVAAAFGTAGWFGFLLDGLEEV
jgi:hypothetical protein